MPTGIYKHKPLSKETKRKLSISAKKVIHTKEWNKKVSLANKGHKHTEKTKRKMSILKKGKINKSIYTKERNKKISHSLMGRKLLDSTKKKISKKLKGRKQSNITKEKKSKSGKRVWSNKEYKEKRIRKMFKSLKLSPNTKEQKINELLQYIVPNRFKFVGDGKFILECFCPDFIDKKNKIIIEHFGDYWHNREDVKLRDKKRFSCYLKNGYKVLIIWENELENITNLKKKIKWFIDLCDDIDFIGVVF